MHAAEQVTLKKFALSCGAVLSMRDTACDMHVLAFSAV
jgi:hypothetical protein